ncbi:MAG: TIGR03016 family PEP-CTERM system-associated outer membrane protein, partial [Gammaproteobacteria bacterium]
MSAAGAQGLGGGIAYPIEPPVFEPGVRASATYSDNIFLRPPGREYGDLLFEVSPYITARSNAPRASYSVFYQMRNFLRVREGNVDLMRQALDARGSFALVDDRLWLDATGYMGNVSQSATGAISADPGASFDNNASVRRFSISPWYRDRICDIASYTLRYSLAHNGGNNDFVLSKIDQSATAVVDGIPSSSRWNWRWHGEYQLRDYGSGITRERRSSGAVLYYNVDPTLRVFGTIEYEQIEGLRNSDGDDFGYGPGAGFDWRPNARTNVSASVSHRYYGTVGEARASYTRGHSTMGIQYSRSVLSS